MRRRIRVFLATIDVERGVSEDDWYELAVAVGALDCGFGDVSAMVEVEVIGATPGWCVHDAVWIVSKAIGQISGLRPSVYVNEVEVI